MNTRTTIIAGAAGLAWFLFVPLEAQSQEPTCRPDQAVQRDGYDSLPDRGKWLLGAAGAPDTYTTLTIAQRATYEAIVHALDHHKLLDSVDAVTAVWGEECQTNGLLSNEGAEQFRLSVVLSRNARSRLWQSKFAFNSRGHVKLANGSSVSRRNTESARGPGDLPKLQVSWRRDDPRIGEIDIDYRSLRSRPHLDPENSDVRESNPAGTPHYCLFRAKYGDELTDWWVDGETRCDAQEVNAQPGTPRGWLYLGSENEPENWPIRIVGAVEQTTETLKQVLTSDGHLVAPVSVYVYSELRRIDARDREGSRRFLDGREIQANQCMVAWRLERVGDDLWIRVGRVACEQP